MNTDIHRLLDDAFDGVEMTPDARDLKEEVRANLVARVSELESAGESSSDAARQAIGELGDVHELLAETTAAAGPPVAADHAELMRRHRVRPKSAYIARTVLLAVLAVGLLVLTVLCALGVIPIVLGPIIAFLGFGSAAIGYIVGDALSQETTMNHPMPSGRAGGYALATFLGVYGLGYGLLVAVGTMPVWAIVFAAMGIVGSIGLFAFLGATQTNRMKSWARDAFITQHPANRFEEEPETAARFGMYTAVIWILTFAVIVVLVFTVGWWWAPLAFVGGLATMMLLLARMMFGPRKDA
jgi:MFS family permease